MENKRIKKTHIVCGEEGHPIGEDNGEWVCMYCVRCFSVFFYFYP